MWNFCLRLRDLKRVKKIIELIYVAICNPLVTVAIDTSIKCYTWISIFICFDDLKLIFRRCRVMNRWYVSCKTLTTKHDLLLHQNVTRWQQRIFILSILCIRFPFLRLFSTITCITYAWFMMSESLTMGHCC
jgi:hypothetical protein